MFNVLQEEECEASMCDSVAGNSQNYYYRPLIIVDNYPIFWKTNNSIIFFLSSIYFYADGTRGIAFEEDEGETGADILPGGFEGNYLTKFIHKKRKIYQQKSYTARCETELSYDPCLDGRSASHSLVMMGKRPSGFLNVSAVPTKRTRTAARQRIVSSFSAGPIGSLPVTSKTDVSSGDTASFQDDQSSRHGYSQPQKNFEADSTVDFERLLTFDSSDIPMKPKKKKPKHLGYKSSLNLPDSKVFIVPENRA